VRYEVGDLVDPCSEYAERVGIVTSVPHVFVHLRGERGYVNHAAVVPISGSPRISDHRGRRRVRAVAESGMRIFLRALPFDS